MSPVKHHRTLHITWPFGGVLLYSIVVLVGIMIAGEVLSRNDQVQAALPPPVINGHDKLGTKLLFLDRMVARGRAPDCIIVGSSQTDKGIDPMSVALVYKRSLGQPFICFNFGISGVNMEAVGRLATILAQEYHPRLLIVGTNFRDYVGGDSLNIPWVNYYTGAPSLEGWLEAESYAFRYAFTFRTVVEEGWPDWLPSKPRFNNGFTPKKKSIDLDATDFATDPQFGGYSGKSKDFEIDVRTQEWLERVVSLNSPDVQVVLVEMPLPTAVYKALPEGEAARRIFAEKVSQTAASGGIQFWLTQDIVLIPDDGWFNLFHLNSTGAKAFSRWVGKRLVAAIGDKQVTLRPR